MRVRIATAMAVSTAVLTAASPAHAAQPRTCTWAGTPAAPTGVFWIKPGITNTPSTAPLKFVATGRLAGGSGCRGTVRFVGQLDTGATCPNSTFRGRVHGLPGVRSFLGQGSLDVPSQLFDRKGRFVGVENANIMTQATFLHATDCNTPRGFVGGWPGMFSSVITLFARGR
jgi:hypothetical protein